MHTYRYVRILRTYVTLIDEGIWETLIQLLRNEKLLYENLNYLPICRYGFLSANQVHGLRIAAEL